MRKEFTPEEIKELVRMARVYDPNYKEGQFNTMVESQGRLADSRLLEIAGLIADLERKYGVRGEQAVERFERILKKLPEMESQMAQYQQRLQQIEGQIQQAGQGLSKLNDGIAAAKAVKEQLERDIREVETRAERETKRLSVEVAKAREAARLSKEEVATASQLYTELKLKGLTVDFVAALAQEIPDDPQARSRLAVAIQRNGSLAADNTAMDTRLSETKTELADIRKHTGTERKNLQELTREREQEERVHSFYRRYQGLGGLMEYLDGWEWVAMRQCKMCGARFWAERKQPTGLVYFQKSYYTCPCCGYVANDIDHEAFKSVGCLPNSSGIIKILLGGG